MSKTARLTCAVIYVDDSQDDHFLFQNSVWNTKTPIHLQPFFSAEPALVHLKGEHPFQDKRAYPFPDFLLCDYDLKSSQAPELITAVRAIPSCLALPIVVFSSSDDQACVARSYAAGADHYLCKPGSMARLDEVVRSLHRCAMLNPASFHSLSDLKEHQRQLIGKTNTTVSPVPPHTTLSPPNS